MTSARTPGPWTWSEDYDSSDFKNGWMYLRAGASDVLAAFGEYCGDFGLVVSPANARLIAAAPDLLAALEAQALTSDYGDVLCFCGDDARNPPLTDPHIPGCEQARAAIAKARGTNAPASAEASEDAS